MKKAPGGAPFRRNETMKKQYPYSFAACSGALLYLFIRLGEGR